MAKQIKKDDMNLDSDIVDLTAAAGFLLFTGADVGASDTIFEIISKFGVVAVLWYWLRDIKSQMKDQLIVFKEETTEIREHHDKIIEELKEEHKDYKDRIDKQINQSNEEKLSLQNKLYDIIQESNKKETE